jgi:hypothetical protein
MKLIQRVKRQMGAESASARAGPPAGKKGTTGKSQPFGRKTTDETNPYSAIPLLRETPANERAEV